MTDSAQNSQESYFTVTPRLIEFLTVLNGASVSVTQAEQVNKGLLELLVGLVVDQNCLQGCEGPEQVTLRTEDKGSFILTNNPDVASNANTILLLSDSLENIDLLNTPKVIWISNLPAFRARFQEAAQFGQRVGCIYNRTNGEIIWLSVYSSFTDQPTRQNSPTQPASPPVQTAFPIEVRFLGRFSETQQSAFELAANRWAAIIRGDLPPVSINGEVVNGILITAVGAHIDGPARVLARAGPLDLRPGSLLPVTGIMEFDTDDLDRMEADASLVNIITHEMGHVLGLGTLWRPLGLIRGAGTDNPTYTGENAMREFARLIGSDTPLPVPLENTGGQGTRDGHWRESVFGNEVMTSFLDNGANPVSRMTVAALQDMGYSVNFNAADAYVLPDNLLLTMMGIGPDGLRHRCGPECTCTMRETKMTVLPESTLVGAVSFSPETLHSPSPQSLSQRWGRGKQPGMKGFGLVPLPPILREGARGWGPT